MIVSEITAYDRMRGARRTARDWIIVAPDSEEARIAEEKSRAAIGVLEATFAVTALFHYFERKTG